MQDKNVRCDGCGSEAWVTVEKTTGIQSFPTDARLDFCAHHYSKHSTLLHAQGWEITNDERSLINVKPSVSANV